LAFEAFQNEFFVARLMASTRSSGILRGMYLYELIEDARFTVIDEIAGPAPPDRILSTGKGFKVGFGRKPLFPGLIKEKHLFCTFAHRGTNERNEGEIYH